MQVGWLHSRAVESPRAGMHRGYQSILELAEACDVPVRWSCRTGVCHNCESGLVSGAVESRPYLNRAPATRSLRRHQHRALPGVEQ